MALTDIKVKAAAVPAGKALAKLSDGGGLYLLVTSAGKYWKLAYRFAGKQKTLSLGVYPRTTLKDARSRRDDAKGLLDRNIDPSQHKRTERRNTVAETQAATFEAVARDLIAKNKTRWSATYSKSTQSRLERHIFPWLGSKKIAEIEAPDLLAVIQRAEAHGKIETAHRLLMLCGQVFRYAIATGQIKSDPSRDLRGALTPITTTNRATITDPKKVGELMRAIQCFEGTFVVHCALRITPYVFTRPGELRHAEWIEVDLEKAEWRIPGHKMKMGEAHIVPLSRQVVDILAELRIVTGSGKYVFPSIRHASRPMSENTINVALRRLGYEKAEMCAHGFRAMASTLLHERGWNSDVIERQLAHKEGNEIKAAYNHARHLPERVKMMQEWADHLDGLRDGAQVIPINRNA